MFLRRSAPVISLAALVPTLAACSQATANGQGRADLAPSQLVPSAERQNNGKLAEISKAELGEDLSPKGDA